MKKKVTLYIDEELLEEIKVAAKHQDRSLSWMLEKAVKLSKKTLTSLPSLMETHG